MSEREGLTLGQASDFSHRMLRRDVGKEEMDRFLKNSKLVDQIATLIKGETAKKERYVIRLVVWCVSPAEKRFIAMAAAPELDKTEEFYGTFKEAKQKAEELVANEKLARGIDYVYVNVRWSMPSVFDYFVHADIYKKPYKLFCPKKLVYTVR